MLAQQAEAGHTLPTASLPLALLSDTGGGTGSFQLAQFWSNLTAQKGPEQVFPAPRAQACVDLCAPRRAAQKPLQTPGPQAKGQTLKASNFAATMTPMLKQWPRARLACFPAG
jgi:hypothetical protein